jgi:dCMP deaminase
MSEDKVWHLCNLCEHGPEGGLENACDSCSDVYSEWKPNKAMLEWHKDMLAKHLQESGTSRCDACGGQADAPGQRFCYNCLFYLAYDPVKIDRPLRGSPMPCVNCEGYSNWTPKGPIMDAVRWTPPEGSDAGWKGNKNPSEKRPSFRQIYMRMAHELSQRSTCRRLQVGCVITSMDYRKVLSVGYNGNASGLANDCDSDEVGNCGCLHAEENAVINCDSPRYVEKVVFCTHLPCRMCAKRIINLGGVRVVYYDLPYRNTESKDMLLSAAIQCCSFQIQKP